MRFPLLLFFAREGGNEDTIPGWGGGTDEKSDVAARVLFVYYWETRPPPPRQRGRYEQHVQRRCGRRTWWFVRCWLVGAGGGGGPCRRTRLRITRRAFRLPPSASSPPANYTIHLLPILRRLYYIPRRPPPPVSRTFLRFLEAFVLSRPETKLLEIFGLSRINVAAQLRTSFQGRNIIPSPFPSRRIFEFHSRETRGCKFVS